MSANNQRHPQDTHTTLPSVSSLYNLLTDFLYLLTPCMDVVFAPLDEC